jgi:hypothetical protein
MVIVEGDGVHILGKEEQWIDIESEMEKKPGRGDQRFAIVIRLLGVLRNLGVRCAAQTQLLAANDTNTCRGLAGGFF